MDAARRLLCLPLPMPPPQISVGAQRLKIHPVPSRRPLLARYLLCSRATRNYCILCARRSSDSSSSSSSPSPDYFIIIFFPGKRVPREDHPACLGIFQILRTRCIMVILMRIARLWDDTGPPPRGDIVINNNDNIVCVCVCVCEGGRRSKFLV